MPIVSLNHNSGLFFELDLLGIVDNNNPKGLGKELWRFMQFRIIKQGKKKFSDASR